MRSLLLLAWLAAPAPGATVRELHDAFIESTEEEPRHRALEELGKATPVTQGDLQSLFDLFMRFSDRPVRDAVLKSLDRIGPDATNLETPLLRYLGEPEPEARLFAIKGCLRLRAAKALPKIEALAKARFQYRGSQDAPLLSEKNAWWVQYEALSALAQWQGPAALPLLLSKADQAPSVARLIAAYYWKESLPKIARWAGSSSDVDREKAQEALRAEVPLASLRAARPEMLQLLRDGAAPKEARHQLALKLGFSSDDEDAVALLKEYQGTTDAQTKVYLAAALFASHRPQAVPVLVDYVKTNPDPASRAGARVQLKELLAPASYQALLEWSAKSDPDPDNRRDAERELKP